MLAGPMDRREGGCEEASREAARCKGRRTATDAD
jgi:hypothetical protein